METIFALSAAPHLPLSLRQRTATPTAERLEHALLALAHAADARQILNVYEFKGEIYIDYADAA